MKTRYFLWIALCGTLSCRTARITAPPSDGFEVRAAETDRAYVAACTPLLREARAQIEQFFGAPFPKPFTVYIHPKRTALDSAWRQEWKMPDFQSQCWMVASGVAQRLDLLSPGVWATEACEHNWNDASASAKLIAHEMTHVYHGQRHASPDFSETSGLDWFVEGLAVYASGQCDAARMSALKKWLPTRKAPLTLDDFWTGPQKYGLSGSLAMMIDQQIGRKKLFGLLGFSQRAQLLEALGTNEQALLEQWKQFMEKI